jgi:hypothetical protein
MCYHLIEGKGLQMKQKLPQVVLSINSSYQNMMVDYYYAYLLI